MKKIIILVGPTGVGKTSLSLELAKKYDSEIISGDSMQVYKEMTIGTAKIKPEEMQGIVHHMIDCFSYKDEFNVKVFQSEARKYIEQISAQNKVPIICGGTGLYIKSLYYDYEFADEEEDEEFKAFLRSRSNDECYGMLKVVDPKSCETIHRNNRKRVERALMRAHLGNKKSEKEEAQKHQPIYDAYVIGLTASRETLYERINKRVDQMMEEGLLEEVKTLIHDESDWQLQSLQGIGYKEWKNYFENQSSLEETVERIKKNSRNFAKRQYTWFNHQMKVHWYNIEEEHYKEKIFKDIEEWIKK